MVAAVFSLNDSWDKEMSCYVVCFGYALQGLSQIFLLWINVDHYNPIEKKIDKNGKLEDNGSTSFFNYVLYFVLAHKLLDSLESLTIK